MENQHKQTVLVPIVEPLNMMTVWEHTPLSYYQYGEYPRFIRPVRSETRSEVRWVKDDKLD